MRPPFPYPEVIMFTRRALATAAAVVLAACGPNIQFDRDDTVDFEFFDGLKVRDEFHHATAGWEVAMDFAVAIAEVNVDGFVSQLFDFGG